MSVTGILLMGAIRLLTTFTVSLQDPCAKSEEKLHKTASRKMIRFFMVFEFKEKEPDVYQKKRKQESKYFVWIVLIRQNIA
jgi:tRNA A37 N6-isopentenylltransferase MiaA